VPGEIIEFNVLVLNDENGWVVQGINLGMAAQGATFHEARRAFEKRVSDQEKLDIDLKIEPFSTIRPAPQVFHEIWNKIAKKWDENITIANGRGEAPFAASKEVRFADSSELQLAQCPTPCCPPSKLRNWSKP